MIPKGKPQVPMLKFHWHYRCYLISLIYRSPSPQSTIIPQPSSLPLKFHNVLTWTGWGEECLLHVSKLFCIDWWNHAINMLVFFQCIGVVMVYDEHRWSWEGWLRCDWKKGTWTYEDRTKKWGKTVWTINLKPNRSINGNQFPHGDILGRVSQLRICLERKITVFVW